MKIINRYVLKEHVGPFVFALSALTSLLLLQYIARRFGDLVGRGLAWQVIAEFFLLSIPFTVAMTLPMAVLVSVLYAFSRLASENEVTALRAGGVSTRSLMWPALIASVFTAIFMLWFNDQLLPRANHELATLQIAIFRTKPTFALKPQVINTIKEGQLYLRAGTIDQDQSGHMRDVTIYDVSDASRRKTIYADNGNLTFAPNHRDLSMRLLNGWVLSVPLNPQGQLDRVYFKQDLLKIRDVANQFQSINADTASKGEREMSVCEMQAQYETANRGVYRATIDSIRAVWRARSGRGDKSPQPKDTGPPPKIGGIGALYCDLITKYGKYLHVQTAHAATLQDTVKRPPPPVTTPRPSPTPNQVPVPARGQAPGQAAQPPAQASAPAQAPVTARIGTPEAAPMVADANNPEVLDAKVRLDDARHSRNRYGVEIQKKFSLAAACIVFVLVGAPIALRFPRGGVGVVIGVSFFVFAVYYVGLIGGESLANKNIISPFWAMWADNLLFAVVGLLLMTRMGHEGVTSRGGSIGELMDGMRDWFARRRSARTTAGGASA